MAGENKGDVPRFGKYRAIREIGRGATSRVYLAEEEGDGGGGHADAFGDADGGHASVKASRVAVKVVDFTDDRSKLSRRFRKLFATEAAVTAQFDHPNIARVYDWKIESERAYLIMELVEGTGLEMFTTMDKLLPMHRVVGIIFKVAMALDYAHRRGIVHRDIKPANVLITKDDEVKLMDFGLALNIKKNVNVDSTFINGLGSPSYMSPEQIKGYTLNHQTDLYSLGVMFYQMLTGRLPFRGPNTAALVYKIINTEAVPVTQLNPDIPEETNKVIARALEKDLYSRYRLGADMAKDLSAIRFQILEDDNKAPDQTKWKSVRGLPLLGKLDDVDIWELLRLSAWRVLPPATVIMRDGEHGKSFGFVLEGDVEVEKGDRALATYGRGELIGEASFLDSEGGTRNATVTTLNQVTFLEINPAAFAFATEELVHEIRRLAIDTLIDRMRVVSRLAKGLSPLAIHPTQVPEGEVDTLQPVVAAPVEAAGWSVFAKPQRPIAAVLAAAAADLAPTKAVPPAAPDAAPQTAPADALRWDPAPVAATLAAPPTASPRTQTVVIQPLPASAAATIAQMALTQHPRPHKADLQPFELGPEYTGEAAATPVSEMSSDTVLTTEMGARFDSPPAMASMDVAPDVSAYSGSASTVEMAPRFDVTPLATTEMAPDFGMRLPVDSFEAAPHFDLHADPRGAATNAPPPQTATTEMGANFDRIPAATPVSRAPLMPPRRPMVDQSTQELASHLLGDPGAVYASSTVELAGGFTTSGTSDPDKFADDLFPPIPAVEERWSRPDPGFDGEAGDEATQMLNLGGEIPLPTLDDGTEDESTQVLDRHAFSVPAPPDAGSIEVTFESSPTGEYERTVELANGFDPDQPAAKPTLDEFFPPLKF